MQLKEIKEWSYRGVSAIERFWGRVVQHGTGCWEWKGCTTHFGYGTFIVHGQLWIASRFMWTITYGDIPEGQYVLHKCDNPPCVNPNHLFLGTYRDNIIDSMRKGRWIARNGESIGTSKLTVEQVEEMRVIYSTTDYTHKELSEQFGVTETCVRFILSGKSWKHAPGPVGFKKDKYRRHSGPRSSR